MTSTTAFYQTLTQIVSDLSQDLPSAERFHRLLGAMKNVFPFDAAAVLKLEDDVLTPLAISGLSEDTLGRRFKVNEHPRLSHALNSREPIHFAADSTLPDPYDGLVDIENLDLHVHDCMGISLYINGTPWGVMTLDALQPGTFDHIDDDKLHTFIRLTEASVKAARRINDLKRLNKQQQLVNQTLVSEQKKDVEIIGNSAIMIELKNELNIVAQSHLTVLVAGETGVGKELIARQIHLASPRAQQPMVYINCAALPESIAESELFGHTKGAFTGAITDRAGKFEIADGGTLFLDEIGEIPLLMQAKLLRVIQSGEIQRVGSDKFIQCDVRIVAATNRDLKHEVQEGRFRSDLYHRLSVYPLHVPALNLRGKDILLLAGYFMEINQHRLGVQGLRLTDEAKQQLLCYAWPGNVRELEHVLSRAALKAIAEQGRDTRSVLLAQHHFDLITPTTSPAIEAVNKQAVDVPFALDINHGLFAENAPLKDVIDSFQQQYIAQKIQFHQGNLAATARELGLNRSNFYRLIKRLGIESNT
jgi:anaerobic nitric oxide reductase transcription regulator